MILIVDKKKPRKPLVIKSNSLENENQLIRIRNDEFGEMPFEFLNEVLVQIQEDYVNGNLYYC